MLPQDIRDDDSSTPKFIGCMDIFYPNPDIFLQPASPEGRNAHVVPLRHLEE